MSSATATKPTGTLTRKTHRHEACSTIHPPRTGPTTRDRVVQLAAKLVLEPIFEADFLPCSYGFRPKRNATMALEILRKQGAKGGHHVLDADIRDYFGSIEVCGVRWPSCTMAKPT